MKKQINYFVQIGFVLLLISCGKNSEKYQMQTAAEQNQTAEGGSVTGGSNYIDDQPIENFIVTAASLPEYKKILKPLLAKINHLSPSLALRLNLTLNNTRTWYLIPGQLQVLSNQQVSIPLHQSTGQFAIHSAKSVWISKDARAKLLTQPQGLQSSAKHILHEMVMAVRVDENLSKNITTLSAEDYSDIRAVTEYLYSQSYQAYDLDSFLMLRNFSDHGSSTEAYQKLIVPPDMLSKGLNLDTTDKLFSFLSKHKKSDLPSLFYGEVAQVLGRCEYDFDQDTNTIRVTTDYNFKGEKKPLQMDISLKEGTIHSVVIGSSLIIKALDKKSANQFIQGIALRIQSNQIKMLSVFVQAGRNTGMNTGAELYKNENWKYRNSKINCLPSVNHLKEQSTFEKVLSRLGIK